MRSDDPWHIQRYSYHLVRVYPRLISFSISLVCSEEYAATFFLSYDQYLHIVLCRSQKNLVLCPQPQEASLIMSYTSRKTPCMYTTSIIATNTQGLFCRGISRHTWSSRNYQATIGILTHIVVEDANVKYTSNIILLGAISSKCLVIWTRT
jgi:hypothetical protein